MNMQEAAAMAVLEKQCDKMMDEIIACRQALGITDSKMTLLEACRQIARTERYMSDQHQHDKAMGHA